MKHKKKEIKKRDLTIIFIIALVILLFFSGYSMAKAYLSSNIEVSGEIAKPVLIVENNPVVQVNGKNEKEYYNFKIKNYKESGEMNQIELKYNIEILSKKDKSISFKLYKNDKEIALKNYKTEDIVLKKETKQEDNYKLEIIYDKTKNDNTVEDLIEDVQIKVHSEQVQN